MSRNSGNMGNPAELEANQRPTSQTKATFSGATAFLGVLSLIITIISVAVPHWGYYSPSGYQYFAQGHESQDNMGHFGPFQVCKYLTYYSYCGGNRLIYQPSTWIKVAGVCGVATILALGLFSLFSILHVAMQLQRREIWISFKRDVFAKLVTASLAVLANFGAVIFGAIELSVATRNKPIAFKIGVCYYLQIFLIFVNALLVILSFLSNKRANKLPLHIVSRPGRPSENSYDQHNGSNGVSMTTSSGVPYSTNQNQGYPSHQQPHQQNQRNPFQTYTSDAMTSYANGHTLPTLVFDTSGSPHQATQPGPQTPHHKMETSWTIEDKQILEENERLSNEGLRTWQASEKARLESEKSKKEAIEMARLEGEKARKKAMERAKQDSEMAKRESEEKIRFKAEKLRLEAKENEKKKAEQNTRKEAEKAQKAEKKRQDTEKANEIARKKADLDSQKEAEENAKKEEKADDKARKKADQKAKKAAEEKAKQAELVNKAKQKADEKTKSEAEKAQKEAEKRVQKEIEQKAKLETEKARKEADKKAKLDIVKAKKEALEKAKNDNNNKPETAWSLMAKRTTENKAKQELEKTKRKAEDKEKKSAKKAKTEEFLDFSSGPNGSNGFTAVGLHATGGSQINNGQPLPIQSIKPIQAVQPQIHNTGIPIQQVSIAPNMTSSSHMMGSAAPPSGVIMNLNPRGGNGVSFTPQGRQGYAQMGHNSGSMDNISLNSTLSSNLSIGSSMSTGSAQGPLRSSLKKTKMKDKAMDVNSVSSHRSSSSSKQVRISLGAEQTQV